VCSLLEHDYRNEPLKAAVTLLILGLILATSAIASPVTAAAGVEVHGSSCQDYTAVNGTAVISFWLQSESTVSNVSLSYFDENGDEASAGMVLIKGNLYDGWWETTIQPSLLKGEAAGATTSRLDVRTLHVSLGESAVDVDVSRSLGSVTVKQTNEILSFFSAPLLWLVWFAGIPISLLIMALTF
jgi:hypothetical protein